MLKCIYPTQANKLGNIAATYRSGSLSIFGTCPNTCSLLPIQHRHETLNNIDKTYLDHERLAVPRRGIAWTYTHFHPNKLNIDWQDTSKTIYNVSTDDYAIAAQFTLNGIPSTVAAPSTDTQWPRRLHGIRFIRCPAEINRHITCQSCGGGRPLCARPNRNYVIVFVAHGAQKTAVTKRTGGCYANTGNCKIQWNNTLKGIGPTTWNETKDPDRLLAWTHILPYGTFLRHRISGDIGLDQP